MSINQNLIKLTFADFLVRSAYQMGKSPVLPLMAASLGADALFLGMIVSVSTMTGLGMKPLFGLLSDRWRRRTPHFTDRYVVRPVRTSPSGALLGSTCPQTNSTGTPLAQKAGTLRATRRSHWGLQARAWDDRRGRECGALDRYPGNGKSWRGYCPDVLAAWQDSPRHYWSIPRSGHHVHHHHLAGRTSSFPSDRDQVSPYSKAGRHCRRYSYVAYD